MRKEHPAFWVYTTIDALQRLVPEGLAFSHIATKEFLDNASDAAEKNGGKVLVSLAADALRISNDGELTGADIAKVLDFSVHFSEKYSRRAYIRGQIGHGLKIAIMMILTETSPVRIISAGYAHTIVLKNRFATEPTGVVDIESILAENDGRTTIECIIPADEQSDMQDYIYRYIALNPHITFDYSSEVSEYKNTSTLKKNSKADIFSYDPKSFDSFSKSYLVKGYSANDIIDLFNINETKIRNRSKLSAAKVGHLYEVIRMNSKQIPQPVMGREAIAQRIREVYGYNLVDYKKLELDGGFAEIAILDGEDPFAIVGVNGSCLYERMLWLRKNKIITTIANIIGEGKIKRSFFFSYCSTAPRYEDSNKQTVVIRNPEVYKAITKLYKKHFPDMPASKGWMKKGNEYKHRVRHSSYLRDKADQMEIQPSTYCFLLDCKDAAEEMHERFGQITLRQLYYRLVSNVVIENNAKSYNNFKNHMKTARQKGLIGYGIFEDRSRYSIFKTLLSIKKHPKDYIKEQLIENLTMPLIDLWENQPYHVELWIEKDALVTLFAPIAKEKQVRLFPSRGYASLTKIEEARKNFMDQLKKGKKVVILYAGDLDPSGWDIFLNLRRSLGGEKDVNIERFALNPEQTQDLFSMPIKTKDTRYKSFLKEHPMLKGAYELDALDPDHLQELTRLEIEKYFDDKLVPRRALKKWEVQFEEIRNNFFKKINLG